MNKIIGIILLIVVILSGAAIVTHQLHVWPWPAATVEETVDTVEEPAEISPTPSVEEIPSPEEVTPASAAEPIIAD